VIAPLVEEFLFRVLLQGWLERICASPAVALRLRRDDASHVRDASDAGDSANVERNEVWREETVDAGALPPYRPMPLEYPFDAYHPPQVDLASGSGEVDASDFRGLRSFAPILISSGLFAAAHAGTWPDPLPLFVLALVLGYVYRQTHRLWPSVVLHMLFNGLALAMVWFGGAG
jgi:hypothetical protein